MAAPKGNMFALGNNGGRPRKYKTSEEMEKRIIEYFSDKGTIYNSDGESIGYNPPTVNGLALFLGFCDRHSLYEYQEKEEFTTIIKRARACIEGHYEFSLNGKNATGAIFALKNMGWADRQEITHNDKRDQAEQSRLIMEALKNKSRK